MPKQPRSKGHNHKAHRGAHRSVGQEAADAEQQHPSAAEPQPSASEDGAAHDQPHQEEEWDSCVFFVIENPEGQTTRPIPVTSQTTEAELHSELRRLPTTCCYTRFALCSEGSSSYVPDSAFWRQYDCLQKPLPESTLHRLRMVPQPYSELDLQEHVRNFRSVLRLLPMEESSQVAAYTKAWGPEAAAKVARCRGEVQPAEQQGSSKKGKGARHRARNGHGPSDAHNGDVHDAHDGTVAGSSGGASPRGVPEQQQQQQVFPLASLFANGPALMHVDEDSGPSDPLLAQLDITYSSWNPPPGQRRLCGDIAYYRVGMPDGEVVHLTGCRDGFFVNRTTDRAFDPLPAEPARRAHSLVELLKRVCPAVTDRLRTLLSAQVLHWVQRFGMWNAPLRAQPWLGLPHTHRPDANRAELSATGFQRGGTRDWNEEYQSIRDLPPGSERDTILTEFYVEFLKSAVRGARAVLDEAVEPMASTNSARYRVWVHRQLFFSQPTEGNPQRLEVVGNDAAAKTCGAEVRLMRVLETARLRGLSMVAQAEVTYRESLVCCQTIIPGIFHDVSPRLLYGSLDLGATFRTEPEGEALMKQVAEVFHMAEQEVLDAEGKSHHYVGSVDNKIIRGTDGRSYLIDLPGVTPRDANFPDPIKHAGCLIRYEAVRHFSNARALRLQYSSAQEERRRQDEQRQQRQHDGAGADQAAEADKEHSDPAAAVAAGMRSAESVADDYVTVDLTGPSSGSSASASASAPPTDSAAQAGGAAAASADGTTKLSEDDLAAAAGLTNCDGELTDPSPEATAALNDEVIKSRLKYVELLRSIRFNTNLLTCARVTGKPEKLHDDGQQLQLLANAVVNDLLPSVVRAMLEMSEVPLDSSALATTMHMRGVNMRYLGRLADFFSQHSGQQAFCLTLRSFVVNVIVMRSARYVLREVLNDLGPSDSGTGAVVAAFLNGFLGRHAGGAGLTREQLLAADKVLEERAANARKQNEAEAALTRFMEAEGAAEQEVRRAEQEWINERTEEARLRLEATRDKWTAVHSDPANPVSLEVNTSAIAAVEAATAEAAAGTESSRFRGFSRSYRNNNNNNGGGGGHHHHKSPRNRHQPQEPHAHPLTSPAVLWQAVRSHARNRFSHELPEHLDLDQFARLAILRGLCLKVGLRLRARDYVLVPSLLEAPGAEKPFQATDVMEFFPVVTASVPTSSDVLELVAAGREEIVEGNIEGGITKLQAGLELSRHVHGPVHRVSVEIEESMALAHFLKGHLRGAVAHQVTATLVVEVMLGADSPDAASQHYKLAHYLTHGADYPTALFHMEHAHAIFRMLVGPNHPVTASARMNVGLLQEAVGMQAEAVRSFREALAGYEASMSAPNIFLAHCQEMLAGALAVSGEMREAVQLATAAKRSYTSVVEPENLLLARCKSLLGELVALAVKQTQGRGAAQHVTLLRSPLYSWVILPPYGYGRPGLLDTLVRGEELRRMEIAAQTARSQAAVAAAGPAAAVAGSSAVTGGKKHRSGK